MRTLAVTVLLGVVSHAQIGNQPGSGFHTLLSSAMRYVINYEQQFALLVLEEHYTQELQRRPSDGTSISRSDPGGTISQQTLRSNYLLVQLGMDGEGWMPFRDTYEVNGRQVRSRDGRLLKLFMSGDQSRFAKAAEISHDSSKRNLGKVVRTINIPLLAMMLLHPRLDDVLATASYTNVRRVLRTELSEQ